MKQDYRWRTPRLATFNLILMEFGDFAMERRMLKGIKARAESVTRHQRASSRNRSGLVPAVIGDLRAVPSFPACRAAGHTATGAVAARACIRPVSTGSDLTRSQLFWWLG
jgi:hypothetical protein